jgi:hypothetical protein
VHDQEYHTSVWGHIGLLGLRDHVLLPGYAGYQGTPAASLAPTNAEVADLAHAQGAVVGYVHPFDSDPDPSDTTHPLTAEFPVDLALGKVDYYEAMGFVDDPMATAHVWYRALNCGFRLPAGAGTDAMANFASLRGPVGMNRVFVHTGGAIGQRALLDSLLAGRTFATNGPLLELSVGGRGVGQELRLPAGSRAVDARVRHPVQRAHRPSRGRSERAGRGRRAPGRRPDPGGHVAPIAAAGERLVPAARSE